MVKTLIFLAAFLIAPLAFPADDEKREKLLSESYGALAGGLCYDVYVSLSDLKSAATSGAKGVGTTLQVHRHSNALKIVKTYIDKVRPGYPGDKAFIEVFDDLEAMVKALNEQADALDSYLQSHSAADLKKATTKKEAARVLLLSLLQLSPESSREAVP
jgi:hypothetical protein